MKIAAMAIIAVIVGTPGRSEELVQRPGPVVTVCMEGDVPLGVDLQAQAIASKIFAQIGVAIRWRRGLASCPPRAIRISLSHNTPQTQAPGALASAFLAERCRITVFYDRITRAGKQVPEPILLGHVLTHEITHILQGTPRHSDHGMMKRRWDGKDYSQMSRKWLEFEGEDIGLIHEGLGEKVVRTQAGQPSGSAVVAAR